VTRTLLVRVLATPGHTFTHLAYVLEADATPVGVFTGGLLLTAFRRAHPPATSPRRTVGELLGRAAQLRTTRRHGAGRRR
jgi:glyoxylase-like metal-dependent hydrolase (beta-lactamase superfamily II)